MDGIFTLPYSEFAVINRLNSHFKKRDGFSIFVPMSRQEKGIDLLILNTKNKKSVTVQIKSSRVYPPTKVSEFEYYMWLHNFKDGIKKKSADYYMIIGLYPVYSTEDKISSKNKFWREIILCYSEKEIIDFLSKIKTKQGKPEKFFGYGFTAKEDVFVTRGLDRNLNVNKHLLQNKIEKMKKRLS